MTNSWPSNVFASQFALDQILVIDPSEGHVGTFFPIEIVNNQYLELGFVQRPGGQDLAIDLWFSQRPWGSSPNFQFPFKERVYGITKTPLRLRIGFFALPLPQVNRIRYVKLIPGKYYVNIHNLENRLNRVRVIANFGV